MNGENRVVDGITLVDRSRRFPAVATKVKSIEIKAQIRHGCFAFYLTFLYAIALIAQKIQSAHAAGLIACVACL